MMTDVINGRASKYGFCGFLSDVWGFAWACTIQAQVDDPSSRSLSRLSRGSRLSAGSRDDLTRDSAGAGGVVFERSHYFEEDNSDMTVDIYADLK